MDYHQKMIVRPTQNYKPKDNVADEDEDDLEALRLAALKSLKAKPNKIPPPQKSYVPSVNSFPIYNSNNNNKNHGSFRGRRDFYQNRPLVRQNGNPNVYYPSRNNQNLIEIIPVEENAPKDGEDKKSSVTPEKENSKFRRYDDASGSEDEDVKVKDTNDQPSSSIPDLSEPTEPAKEEEQTDSEIGEVTEAILLSESPGIPSVEEENDDEEVEVELDKKRDEDDDDVLLMADSEEEDSLERLMDEMEREMAGKPLEKKEKNPRRDKIKKEKSKPETKTSSSISTPALTLTSSQNYKDRPESPYERPRHRSPSPKTKRKKSPRRSPSRLKKPRQRSPRRSPPRSPAPKRLLLSPRRRSRSRSPRNRRSPRSKSPRPRSPVRNSGSPKISPRMISPRRHSPPSAIHSPWSSPRNSPWLSPKRRRSPVASTTSNLNKEKESRKKRSNSPEDYKTKEKEVEINDPVLEARRRKFESTKLIDPVNDNKKIKLSRKAEEEEIPIDEMEIKNTVEDDTEEGELKEESDEEKDTATEGNGDEEIVMREEETEFCLDESYDLDELEEHVSDEAIFEPMKKVEKRTKKKKKDKELYQVGKLKELPLSERLGQEKKCKKRKEYEVVKVDEGTGEDVVDEEADLRTELSRRRAKRLNRNVPMQSARLLQSAFKGVVNEVAKNNSKALQRQLMKEDKHPQKEMRRVTVLHRSIPELHDSEDEMIDSKVPIKFRLGLNKVQETRESKSSRKSSKRQGRKVKHKNLLAN